MDNRAAKTSGAIVIALVMALAGVNSSAYGLSGHGVSYAPSFGGGDPRSSLGGLTYHFHDGLTINGDTFDISKYVQTIPTETLYIGTPTSITVKMWEFGGTYQIQGAALMLNVRGYNPNPGQSDTWVQYSKISGVTVHDPNGFLGPVKADVTYDKNFMYVTFHFTPQKPMNTSWMIVTAWDKQLSIGTAKISNAVNISYLPFAYH